MFVWNWRSHFGRLLAALAFLFSLIGEPWARAASDPEALRCVESFLNQYQSLRSYRALLHKKEWSDSGKSIHDEKIEMQFTKPQRVVFKYLNEGETGIRNNGMTVTYESGNRVGVSLGSSSGLGFLVKGIASIAVGSSLSLYDSKVIDGEIFTLNRAGYDFLAKALQVHISALKDPATQGGLKLLDSATCLLEYQPHQAGDWEVEVKPEESIHSLEDKYGVLAWMIWKKNQDKVGSAFRDLFDRRKTVLLQVPKAFAPFRMELNEKGRLLSRFELLQGTQRVGDYRFELLEVEATSP